MAEVILRVDFTLAMRFLRSRKLGIPGYLADWGRMVKGESPILPPPDSGLISLQPFQSGRGRLTWRLTMMKKLALGLLVLVVVLGAGGYYLFLNLDHYIKVAIEKYGTAATQSEVSLSSVSLSVTTGADSAGRPHCRLIQKAFPRTRR